MSHVAQRGEPCPWCQECLSVVAVQENCTPVGVLKRAGDKQETMDESALMVFKEEAALFLS